jgi:hypothetical protein
MDWIDHHIRAIKILAGLTVPFGALVAAVVPDQLVYFASTLGTGFLAWAGTALWKASGQLSRVVERQDLFDQRLSTVEQRLWDEHAR